MTKTEIITRLLKVVDILQMDCHEYLDYRKKQSIIDCSMKTDFYSVFYELSGECISELAYIIRSCHENKNVDKFAFFDGRFVISNYCLSYDDFEKLKLSSKRYMLKYGMDEFSKNTLKEWGYL